MKLHPHAASLFAIADPSWRRKIFTGGLLLLVAHPLAWPAVLGYRKALAAHLFAGTDVPLPAWRGLFFRYFLEGVKGMAVIFGYLAPLYVALGALAVSRGFVPGWLTAALVLFFVVFPIFSTLSFPVACCILTFGPGAWIRGGECALFAVAFAFVVFLVPAGFMRVSQTGRYRSAFDLRRTLSLLFRNFRGYLSAWWYAGLISLFGHFAIPFSPWGVVWAYLAIIFLFNEILHHAGEAPGRGWLARSLDDPRFVGRERFGLARLQDGRGEEVKVLDLRAFSVPLPRWSRARKAAGG